MVDLKALMRREGAKGSVLGEADADLLKKMEPLQGSSYTVSLVALPSAMNLMCDVEQAR